MTREILTSRSPIGYGQAQNGISTTPKSGIDTEAFRDKSGASAVINQDPIALDGPALQTKREVVGNLPHLRLFRSLLRGSKHLASRHKCLFPHELIRSRINLPNSASVANF